MVLEDGKRTTVRVGESVELRVPLDRRYSRPAGNTSPFGTLALVRRSRNSVFYRAVQPGPDIIIVSPVTAPGECISCATLHYFITVVTKE
jgi:hypothetical protein